MGRRGPPKRPTELTVLLGNPGRRPLREGEAKPRRIAPEKPVRLTKRAAAIWGELAPKLSRIGLLTEVDGPAFTDLCETEALLEHVRAARRRKRRLLARAASGYESPQALVSLELRLLRELRNMRRLFGLSPSDRASLHIKPPREREGGILDDPARVRARRTS